MFFAQKQESTAFISHSVLCRQKKMLKIRKPNKSFFFKAHEEADEMLRKSFKITVRIFCRLIGCDIFLKKFSVHTFMFYCLFFDLISYSFISIYNIYLFREDFIRSTFCVVTLGMGFQGAIKLYTFVFHRSDMLRLYDLIVIFQQSVTSLEIKNALENSVLNVCIASLVLIPTYVVSGVLMFIYPIVYYMVYNEKILHFGFILPFIDEHSQFGYALNFFHHSLQIYVVINATIGSNIGFITFTNGAFGQYDALQLLIKKLNTVAMENIDGCNDQLIKHYIKEIASIHVELIE